VYPARQLATFDSRKDWIWPSVIVVESKKTASLMICPGWNCDRSAVKRISESVTDAWRTSAFDFAGQRASVETTAATAMTASVLRKALAW
jgi:hypothetical protein